MEINSVIIDRLGLTLIDSVWQGAILIAVAFLSLVVLKRASAKIRHNFLLICILALPAWGVYTFHQHGKSNGHAVDNSISITDPTAQTTGFNSGNEEFSTEGFLPNISSSFMGRVHWIAIIWVIGLSVFVIRSLGGFLYLNRLKSKAWDIKEKEWNQRFNELKQSLGLKLDVLIKESDKLASPLVYGYLKPVILFPAGLIQGLTVEEVEVILLHELAHLKRNDYVINIIINVLSAVYFYHPAFWWLQSQLDNEREFATDEIVMNLKKDNLLFIKALTKTKEFQMMSPALGFAGSSKNQLLERVNRIMKKQQNPNWLSPMLSIIVLGTAFFLMSQAQTKEQVKEETPKPTISVDSSSVSTFTLIADSMMINGDGKTLKLTVDSIAVKKLNFSPLRLLQSDTNELQKAIAEIVKKTGSIKFEIDDSGKITEIERNGKKLKGEEFKTYEKAYQQLQEFAMKLLEKEEKALDKERQKLLEQETSVLKEELERLKAELDSKDKQDVEMRREEVNMRKEVLKRLEEQLDLKDKQEVSMLLREEFNRHRGILKDQSQLKRKEVLALQKRLAGMMDENELNELKSNIKTLEHMESVYNSIRSNMSYLTITSDEPRWTTSTKEKLESTTKNPLIILNGKSKSKWKLSDLYELDRKTISRLQLYNGEVMKKKYSKRKIKGRDAVIEITTK